MKLILSDLKKFLCEAKKNTFAADAPRSPSLRPPYSKNYIYIRDPFRYEDQYFGEFVDVGEEIVWMDGFPIWGMGYRGGIVRDFISLKKIAFDFLREAIRNPDPDFPTRGPKFYSRGEFEYHNKVSGDITDFFGEETVYSGINIVCFRKYVGGLIWGKATKTIEVIGP